jgi:hypothetical protein
MLDTTVEKFRPNGNTTNHRRQTFTFSGDFLDTELGGEEYFAEVHLRNASLTGPDIKKNTPRVNISP